MHFVVAIALSYVPMCMCVSTARGREREIERKRAHLTAGSENNSTTYKPNGKKRSAQER